MPDDLTQMVRAHWREVYSLLVAITRQPAMAEDLAQEVFLVAHRKQIRAGNGARFWLREAARRLAMNELRRKRPAPTAPEDMERLMDSEASQCDGMPNDDYSERLAALRKCLEEIPAPDRAILAARYDKNLPMAQIAAESHQSVGYLKQRLYRLRRRLAECVQRKTTHPTLTHANA